MRDDDIDVQELADEGYSYEEIVEEFLDAGYDQEDIDEAFADTGYDWQDALYEAIENQVDEIDLDDAQYYADLLGLDSESDVYDIYYGYGDDNG
jgi:hypothetical protein